MCRLTAWVGRPRALDVLVYGGDHPLLEQAWAPRELLQGSVNADGWGVAWLAGGRAVRLASSRPVWQEADLEGVLAVTEASVAVAALRNATEGLPADGASVPPLVGDGRAFVLNGFVPDFRERHARALRADLPDDLYARLAGASDAETLFLLVTAALREGASPAEALESVASRVLERVERAGGAGCQLALLLAHPGGVTVRLDSNRERCNSLYVLEDRGLASGGALLASEALDGDAGWRPVPAHVTLSLAGDGTAAPPA